MQTKEQITWDKRLKILRQMGAIMILGVVFYVQIGLLFIFDKSAFSIEQRQKAIIRKQADTFKIAGNDVGNKKRTHTKNDVLKNEIIEMKMYREDINNSTKNESNEVIRDDVKNILSSAIRGASKGSDVTIVD